MTAKQNNWIETFLQEAEDILAEIEEAALALSEGETEGTIDRLFRAFHTLKGSSGMCGLTPVADFTHHIESLLDMARDGRVPANPELGSLMLEGRDLVRAILVAEQGGEACEQKTREDYLRKVKAFAGESAPPAAPAPQPAATPAAPQPTTSEATWKIRFKPMGNLFACGGNPLLLLRELSALGNCEVQMHVDTVPTLEALEPTACYLWWSAQLRGAVDQDAIRDVFMFVEDGSELEITASDAASKAAPSEATASQQPAETPADSSNAAKSPAAKSESKTLTKESTVRVPSARLDQLVNLVGELVMNQSRLTQVAAEVGTPELLTPVEEIERLVAELRDDVLSIRMLPIGTLFGRFRRLMHDLSKELNKDIELVTEGSETELDKSILDQLSEPLVHCLRNSADHGIESEEQRRAAGKPPKGTVRLTATHMGSNVVVSVEDDGRGINRAAIRAKAIEKGLVAADANLSDKEILNLLLLPGFSTAKKVTNISGRGVGMDVVKRQIDSLRGSLTITSEEGQGTKLFFTLPLTLAIIEGLLVKVNDSRLIVPMSAVQENVELQRSERAGKNGRNVISVRGELIPYIDLRSLFNMGGEAPEAEKVIILEHEGERVGFVVEQVLGTHQTVLQPLGRFFRDVAVSSGATIMGDGGVALILDIPAIIKYANQTCREASTRTRTA